MKAEDIYKKIFANVFVFAFLTFPFFAQALQITNPIPPEANVNSITDLIRIILDAVTLVAIPIIVLAFVYSGFLFIKAQGSGNELKEARGYFMNVVIGAAIILSANVIFKVVEATIKSTFAVT